MVVWWLKLNFYGVGFFGTCRTQQSGTRTPRSSTRTRPPAIIIAAMIGGLALAMRELQAEGSRKETKSQPPMRYRR